MPYSEAYKAEHSEEIKERQKKASKKWADNNKDKISLKNKKWRKNNRKRSLEHEAARYTKFRNYVNEVKDVPCMDCGASLPPCCMDFHHRDPAEKLFGIGACSTRRREVLDAEIAKCDIICANCHRIRHFEQEQRTGS